MSKQQRCSKCSGLYCPGHDDTGVCTTDMDFTGAPLTDGDNAALYLRKWYEAHREKWRDRRRRKANGSDHLMLGLINEVARIEAERKAQEVTRQAEVATKEGRQEARPWLRAMFAAWRRPVDGGILSNDPYRP
jgi:hypothetical protein